MSFKNSLCLLFLLSVSLSSIYSQRYDVQQVIGKWNYQGSMVDGTFYFANSWSKQTFEFRENFTFKHSSNNYENKQIITKSIEGNWQVSTDSSMIILFYSKHRWVHEMEVKTVYKVLPIQFLNARFFTFDGKINQLSSEERFLRENVESADYTLDRLAYQQERMKKSIVIDTLNYLQIISSDTLVKPYRKANYTFVTDEMGSSTFLRKVRTIHGQMMKVQQDSIWLRPLMDYSRVYAFTGKSTLSVKINLQKDSTIRFSTHQLKRIYLPKASLGMEISSYFTFASIASALLVTPIVAATSSFQNRSRNAWITAGTGLIGIGIGTGSFYFFRSLVKKYDSQRKDAVHLLPIFHRKAIQ